MQRFRPLRALVREEDGQDIVEFALISALISILTILVVQAIGPHILRAFLGLKIALLTVRDGLF